MKQERNKSITLDEQVSQTKQNIAEGKDTYPIDIVETNQIYYGLPNTVDQDEKNIYKLMAEKYSRLQKIDMEYGCVIITGGQPVPEPISQTEMKVFMVDVKFASPIWRVTYRTCPNNIFIEQSRIEQADMSLEQFQRELNERLISMDTKYIRFIDVPVK